jgi:uncharacterized protein (DUF433 family)/DNA-binding transcriptional MerR regulator
MTASRPRRSTPHARMIATYPAAEAAWALALPTTTLRSWVQGRSYRTATGIKRWPALVDPAGSDPQGVLLSFMNLVELHVLRAFREADVSVRAIREAIEWLRRQSPGNPHPLVRKDLHTYGNGIFIKKIGEIVEISSGGQHAIREAVEEHLSKVEWDDHLPARLYPCSAKGSVSFEIDPNVGFGQLRIAGTRVPVAALLDRHEAGESYKSLADDYGQPRKTIQAAIASFRPAA